MLSLFFGSIAFMMFAQVFNALRVPSSAFDAASERSLEEVRRSLQASATLMFAIGLVFAIAGATAWVSWPLGLGIACVPFLLGILLYLTGGLEIISRLSVGD